MSSYQQQFHAMSGAFCAKDSIDVGGKIILPNSAMITLAHLHISYPMLFNVRSSKGKLSHCGVLEFTAEEGTVVIPYWMMEQLFVSPGEIVTVSNVSLPKGKFIKIRPQQQDFIKTANPKAILENALTNYTCLTKGDSIPIDYNSRRYMIDIMEVVPVTGSGNAVCIVEADVEVDFDRPLDMPPSPKNDRPKARGVSPPPGGAGGIVFGGNKGAPAHEGGPPSSTPQEVHQGSVAFTGVGRSLTGKTVSTTNPSPSHPTTATPVASHPPTSMVGTGRSLSGKVENLGVPTPHVTPTAAPPIPTPAVGPGRGVPPPSTNTTAPPAVPQTQGRSLSGKTEGPSTGASPSVPVGKTVPAPPSNTTPSTQLGGYVPFGGTGRKLA
eukprot:PhF_6_TR20816/c0_g1_i1/m.29948/K14016/UFD1; ubiquitin fusion degradation protein 1